MRTLCLYLFCTVWALGLGACCNHDINLNSNDTNPDTADFCAPGGGNCPSGTVCCPSEAGARCMASLACLGEVSLTIPEWDPSAEIGETIEWPQLSGSCLEEALLCPGDSLEMAHCTAFEHTGIVEVAYNNSASGVFFTTFGMDAARLSRETPCYEIVSHSDDTLELRVDERGLTFEITVVKDLATVVCPDETTEEHPWDDIARLLPTRPHQDLCEVGIPVVGARTCGEDTHCPGGAVCCLGEVARVCDPGLCGESRCCEPGTVHTCSETPSCEGEQTGGIR